MKKVLFSLSLIFLTASLVLNAKRVGTYYDIDTTKEYNSIVQNGYPSVLYYYTSTCEACKESSPGFEQLSQELGNQYNFIKLNLDKDECKNVGNFHKVEAVPTTIVKDRTGKNVGTIRGSQSTDSYKKNVKSHLTGKTPQATQPTYKATHKKVVQTKQPQYRNKINNLAA